MGFLDDIKKRFRPSPKEQVGSPLPPTQSLPSGTSPSEAVQIGAGTISPAKAVRAARPVRFSGGAAGGGGASISSQVSQPTQQKQVGQDILQQQKKEAEQRRKAEATRQRERTKKIRAGTIVGQVISPTATTPKSRRGTEEFGVFTISEEERSRAGVPSRPFAVTESGMTPSDAVSLGRVFSEVALSPSLPGRVQPEASFRKGRADILEAQATAGLVSQFKKAPEKFIGQKGVLVEEKDGQRLFTAEPEFFESRIDRESIKAQVKRDVFGRPTRDIIGSRALEVGIGGAQIAVGAGEFGINLASQLSVKTIELDEQGKIIDKSFKFNGIAGKIRDQPAGFGTTLGKIGVIAPLATLGIGQFIGTAKTVGVGVALGETVTAFSPFKIPTQTFGVLEGGRAARDLKFDVASFKQTTGDVTKRVVVGKARGLEDVTLLSRQVVKQVGGRDVGFAITDITAPKTTFQLGQFTRGITTVRTGSVIGGIGGGQASAVVGDVSGLSVSQVLGQTGAASRVATKQISRLSIDEAGAIDFTAGLGRGFGTPRTFGSVSDTTDDTFSIFASGRGRRILRVGKGGGQTKVKIDQFNVRGVEFDIARFSATDGLGTGGGITGRVTRGGGLPSTGSAQGLGTDTKTVAKQLSASILDLKQAPAIAKTAVRAPTRADGVFGLPSTFAGTGQFELTEQAQTFRPSVTTRQEFLDTGAIPRQRGFLETRVIPTQRDILDTRIISGQKEFLDTRLVSGQKSFLDTRSISAQRSILDTRTLQGQRQQLIQRQQLTLPQQPLAITETSFGFGSGAFGGFGGAGFALPGLVSELPERKGVTRGKKKRRERIAPSLTGITAFDFGEIFGGPLEVSGVAGRSPFELRFVPKNGKKGRSLATQIGGGL